MQNLTRLPLDRLYAEITTAENQLRHYTGLLGRSDGPNREATRALWKGKLARRDALRAELERRGGA